MKVLTVVVGSIMLLVVESATNSCPPGWRWYMNRCYLYVPKLMTWSQAERNCINLEAHLASVSSLNEELFIKKVIEDASHGSGATWTGGYNMQEISLWFWSDGKAFTYKNWCNGEPDNKGGWQFCTQINYSEKKCWDDVGCKILRPFVCKKYAQ